MNYKRIHDSIINRSKDRILEGYSEKHHILPRCLGGNNSKDNIAILTAKEHYVIHRLLTRIYPEQIGLIYAFWMMSNGSRKNRHIPSPRAYEEAKVAISLVIRDRPGPNLGRKMSDETRKRISESKRGVPTCWHGRKHSPESKAKQRMAAMNRSISKEKWEEMNIKRSKALKGKKKPEGFGELASKRLTGVATGLTGAKSPLSKKVDQFTLDDKFIRTWDSARDIEREFELKFGRMWSVLHSQGQTLNGFKWKYHNEH